MTFSETQREQTGTCKRSPSACLQTHNLPRAEGFRRLATRLRSSVHDSLAAYWQPAEQAVTNWDIFHFCAAALLSWQVGWGVVILPLRASSNNTRPRNLLTVERSGNGRAWILSP